MKFEQNKTKFVLGGGAYQDNSILHDYSCVVNGRRISSVLHRSLKGFLRSLRSSLFSLTLIIVLIKNSLFANKNFVLGKKVFDYHLLCKVPNVMHCSTQYFSIGQDLKANKKIEVSEVAKHILPRQHLRWRLREIGEKGKTRKQAGRDQGCFKFTIHSQLQQSDKRN